MFSCTECVARPPRAPPAKFWAAGVDHDISGVSAAIAATVTVGNAGLILHLAVPLLLLLLVPPPTHVPEGEARRG